MSSTWQDYVNALTSSGDYVTHAAIVGQDGSGVWASSPGLDIAPHEIAPLVASYEHPRCRTVQLEGVEWIVTASEDLLLRCKTHKSPTDNLLVYRTHKVILACKVKGNEHAPTARNTLEQIGNQLISNGF